MNLILQDTLDNKPKMNIKKESEFLENRLDMLFHKLDPHLFVLISVSSHPKMKLLLIIPKP